MASTGTDPRPDTVDALVETVREFLRTEDGREDSVNTRGAGLAVFGGVILSLTGSLGRSAIKANLPGGWDTASVLVFAATLLSLVAAVVLTVLLVLLPRESASISMRAIKAYPRSSTVTQEKVFVQGSTLVGLVDLLAIDRQRISRKTGALRLAYVLLVLGLIGVTALGGILGLHDARML